MHGLTPLGSTGEFAYLSWQQRRRVVEVVVEAAGGRVPVVAGVGSTTTADATFQARQFERLGCAGILAILEAYFPIADDGVFDYFRAIAESVSLPVVLYTNPNFQRSDLSLAVIDRLSHVPNIRYLKDASSNTGRLLTIIGRVEGRIEVFAASAHIPACVMMIGGVGWMAGPACVAPRKASRSTSTAGAGTGGGHEVTAALQLNTLRQVQPGGLHQGWASVAGYPVGDPLPPQAALSPEGGRNPARARGHPGALTRFIALMRDLRCGAACKPTGEIARASLVKHFPIRYGGSGPTSQSKASPP